MISIDLTGCVAVVTGGQGDIGQAIVTTLRDAGAKVVTWDIAPSKCADTVDQCALTVDVTQEQSIMRAVGETLARFGRIDILVNGAGVVGKQALMEHYDPAEWRRIIEINLTSVFLCSRAVIPAMREQRKGRIVNIASNAGKDCNPYQAAYSSSKAAVIGLTKSLGRELAEAGILVNCVTPALIDSAMERSLDEPTRQSACAKIPMKRMGRPDEVAALVAWLSSEQCSFSTGAAFDLSGGRSPY